MSFITIPGLLGPLLGPTVGGWLVEILSWHWIFLLNLPVGLLGCYAVWKFIPSTCAALNAPASIPLASCVRRRDGADHQPWRLGELHLPHLRVMLLLFAGMACLAAMAAPGATPSRCSRPACSACAPSPLVSSATCSRAWAAAPLPFLVPLLLQVALAIRRPRPA